MPKLIFLNNKTTTIREKFKNKTAKTNLKKHILVQQIVKMKKLIMKDDHLKNIDNTMLILAVAAEITTMKMKSKDEQKKQKKNYKNLLLRMQLL